LAEEFAEQTDLIGHDGTLLYMQDTSATHLSNFGMVSYRVGLSTTEAGARNSKRADFS